MTGWRNIPLVRAERYAAQFIRLVELSCVAVSVAGAVRRCRDVTSEPLEIVAAPLWIQQTNLFGESLPSDNVLADTIAQLLKSERVEWRKDRGRQRTADDPVVRLLFRADGGMLCPVDVWMTTTEAFGAVLALRTGPYGYRSRLMTPRGSLSITGASGLLPREMRLDERRGLVDRNDDTTLYTPTESHFFGIIGERMLPPEERR